MKVNYGIHEVTTYKIVREHSDENSGGIETLGEFRHLEHAERTAELLSEAEEGSSWYTVPKKDERL